ncbi:hypothetical protein [Helicobacter winghamensis]|uniref:Uncharacterized protein n=1 Tax=Helicobacter winghamensis TaxID=157268 RepID=A0A2N3PIU8_9HELI|nr:hypothetical protein [Helicobacter winghamensis]EEO25296.1 hypothetical protein HWAG_00088 [Helicobacter winghamensis ATCC BAA-430]PKT76337.1 hypothetical protein BCM35_06350 [Helicobacter winghamensis]PKT76468.1 hypothetical protein BCM32_03505 [Helicobacter winghamensis]PKT76599.1 hypothetical protein BCM34_04880 [Helicobacter winghamensis]PKT80848.1 hypothetical protein BCM31_02490 [Helicobacter winghamensis]
MKKCCPKLPIAFIIVFIVSAFIYYQYSFTSLLKIDFTQDSFYSYTQEGVSLFVPESKRYNLCIYNGFLKEQEAFLQRQLGNGIPLLAIDFYQQGQNIFKEKNFNLIRISSSLMLKLIHGFNLKTLPQCFIIKQDIKNPMQYTHLKDFGFYKVINFKTDNKEK